MSKGKEIMNKEKKPEEGIEAHTWSEKEKARQADLGGDEVERASSDVD